MENTDYAGSPGVRDVSAGVIFRLSCMNDDRPGHLRGQVDLGSESGTLGVARRIVVVVVEAAFADRNGGTHERTQPRYVAVFVKPGRVVRMDSSGRENKAGIRGRVFTRKSRRLQRLPDADDGRRARTTGARDYLVAVAGERRVREVGVAVDEGRRASVLRGHLRSIQRSTGAAM